MEFETELAKLNPDETLYFYICMYESGLHEADTRAHKCGMTNVRSEMQAPLFLLFCTKF
jgi:hypothetical protein